jgi:uncharacterized protein YcbX
MPIQVQELVVFPIKSLRGISVPSAKVAKRGLTHDRRWMLVDEEGKFLTARRISRMVLIDTGFTANGIQVGFKGKPGLEIPFETASDSREVQVWNSICNAYRVSTTADAWFSDVLDLDCSLVYMPEETQRPISSLAAEEGDIVGFADSNPILVAGQASIDDLNSKLPEPIPIRRFRANVILSGSAPFAEDEWSEIAVGDVKLRKTNRCARCAVPTIDIETGVSSDEPLRTLNAYRNFDNKVWFGCFYAPDTLGEISVGDPVTVA